MYIPIDSHSMGVNGEALQLLAVYKKPYFYCKSRDNLYQVLQVTWESVSGTASHARCVWMCNEIKGSYDKIIIIIVPSYTKKNISLVCCRLYCYECAARVTMPTATNSWYFPV